MRGFVVAWFYPPTTSAEGIVTYKLLKESEYEYDVFCSTSKKWSYNCSTDLKSDNTNVISVETDDFKEWIDKAIEYFTKNRNKYDFIMTRSMPPESQLVGLEIKKRFPEIKWIASFADPIGKNPYELLGYLQGKYHDKYIKYAQRPRVWIPLLALHPKNNDIRFLNGLLKLEYDVIKNADKIIFPSQEQADYTFGKKTERFAHKALIVPHSYDLSLYPKNVKKDEDHFTFIYTGHSDNLRNPNGFIEALNIIRDINPELFSKMRIRIIGNVPEFIKDKIFCFYLHNNVTVEPTVNYIKSLEIIQQADCLLHVDAFFVFLQKHFFFASKLADYIGTGIPIIAATPEKSTASRVLKTSISQRCNSWEYMELAKIMCKMYYNRAEHTENIIDTSYDNKVVAKNYDAAVKELVNSIKEDNDENINHCCSVL